MTRENKVSEFMKAAGTKPFVEDTTEIGTEMIGTLIVEETKEFLEAIVRYFHDQSEENRANLVKEWADTQYVLSQAAVFFDIPADPSFNRVHANNMTKIDPETGTVIKREDGKILKPEGFKPLTPEDMKGL